MANPSSVNACGRPLFQCTPDFSTEKSDLNPSSLPKPLLWSASGVACGLCGPTAASSVPADVYGLDKCKHFLQIFKVVLWVLFPCSSSYHRRIFKKRAQYAWQSLPELQPHLLSFPQGRDVGCGVCFWTCHDWRASFMTPDRNGACWGYGWVITFFSLFTLYWEYPAQ